MATNEDLSVKIEQLVRQTESLQDSRARTIAIDLLQAVMAFHAAGLERVLETVSAQCGVEAIQSLAADETVSRLLVLHGLHPDDVATRVRRAMEKLHMYFDSRGAGIELLEASSELVRVRLTSHRPGSRDAAKQVIENAIYEAAPDIQSLIIDGIEESHDPAFVPLNELLAAGQRL